MTKLVQKELCVSTLEAARIANTLPIDRIETCVALELGGLTPTGGMVNWIHNTFHIEQHILIRQRAGGFHYAYDEIVVMRDDILHFKKAGVKGVVVGALKADFSLDVETTEIFVRAAARMDLTFHRAFDEVKDWRKTMDKLVSLGFKRILTSGQARSVDEGLDTLAEMVEYAAGRIEIMAGGGVRASNKDAVIATGVDAVHFSGTVKAVKDEGSMFKAEMGCPDERLIAELAKT